MAYLEEEGEEGLDDLTERSPTVAEEGPDDERAAPPPEAPPQPMDPLLATLPTNYQRKVQRGEMTVADAIAQRVRATEHAAARNSQRAKNAVQGQRELAAKIDRLERIIRGETVDDEETGGIPPLEVDPLGNVAGKVDMLAEQLAEEKIERQVESVSARIEESVARDYERTVAEHPYYNDAERFMVERAQSEEYNRLEMQFPEYPPDVLEAQAARNVAGIAGEAVVRAHAEGKSIHQIVMAAAWNAGWRPAGQQPVQYQQPPPSRQAPGTAQIARAQQRRQQAGAAMQGPSRPQPHGQDFRGALDAADDNEFDRLMRQAGGDEEAAFRALARNLAVD